MDELLKELRNYLADAAKRERAADERAKRIEASIEKIADALTALTHTYQDQRR
jgi:DNA topoisomerase VI subunit B